MKRLTMTRLAEPLLKRGGPLFTMTCYGSQMVVENYNIMGAVKAAPEHAVRYITAKLGPKSIRIHAIALGPFDMCAAPGITESDELRRN